MGGYGKWAHRLHVPLITHPNATFRVCPADVMAAYKEADTGANGAEEAGGGGAGAGPAEGLEAVQPSRRLPTLPADRGGGAGHGASALAADASVVKPTSSKPGGGGLGTMSADRRKLQAAAGGRRHRRSAGRQPPPAAQDVDMEDLDCHVLDMPRGLVLELNNRVPHRVDNASPLARVHLIIDVAESPRPQAQLAVGAVCEYENGYVYCPPEALAGGPVAARPRGGGRG
jgi:hypothetical protein